MHLEQAKQFLRTNRGYLKKGDAAVAERLNIPLKLAHRAKVEVKTEIKALDEFGFSLPDHQLAPTVEHMAVLRDIDPHKITKYKAWQNMKGEPRWSIDVNPHLLTPAEQIELFQEMMGNFEVPIFEVPQGPRNAAGVCSIINLYDAHIDKICWVFDGSYWTSTLEKNIENFEKGFDECLTEVALNENPEVLIIPMGNDFWTTNGPSNTTKRGTPQQVHVPSHISYQVGLDVLIKIVYKAKQALPNSVIKIPWIKGNHDEDKTFYASDCMARVFENDPQVEIDHRFSEHKFIRYYNCLFGFAHGHNQSKKLDRVPLVMAEEAKSAWAQTRIREFFLGDKHTEREYYFQRNWDAIGCRVQYLRSIVPHDNWEADNTYFGIVKSAEVFTFPRHGIWRRRFSWNWQVDREQHEFA